MVSLFNLTKRIEDQLAINKLLTVLEIYDSTFEALARFVS